MKYFVITAVMLLSGFQFAFAQNPDSTLSLDQCITRGLLANNLLNAKRLSALSAQSDSRAYNAQKKPTLALKGSYNYTSETQNLGGAFPSIPGIVFKDVRFGDGNVYDFNATMAFPLYSGGAVISRQRAAEADENALRFDLQADSLTLLLNIRKAYFMAAGAKASLAAAEMRQARLRRHLDELEVAKYAGLAAEDTRLALDASLKSAEAAVMQSKVALRNAQLQLGKLIGKPSNEISPQANMETPLASYDDSTLSRPADRPEIRMLDAKIEQRNRLRRANLASLFPSLGANAVYHYAKPGVDAIENEWMDYYTLGVSATWTIWDFNEGRSRANSQSYLAQSLRAAREDAISSLEMRVNAARQTLNAAAPSEQLLKERFALESRRAELVRNKLTAGLTSESQWLDAQDDLTAAELDWISSVVALRISEADFLYAIGR